MLIAIEGIDCGGKSTQVERIVQRTGAAVYRTPARETMTGHAIAGHLKEYWQAQPFAGDEASYWMKTGTRHWNTDALNALVHQALHVADRYAIAPEIADRLIGGPVVLDRWWPSAWVYGQIDGLDRDWLVDVHRLLPIPDRYVLIDVDAVTSFERRPERRDRYEEEVHVMERAAALYRDLWTLRRGNGDRWHVVDGRGTPDEVEERIRRVL